MVDVVSFLDDFDDSLIIILILLILILEVFLLSFPKEIVMIYAGVKFGIFFGGILNLIGLFGAAWLGYEGGKYGRFGLEKRRDHPLMQKYEGWLARNGLKSLAIVRLIPLTPNDVLSVSSGFSKLPRYPYLIITFITAIPYAFFISWVGSEHVEDFIDLFPQVFEPTTWIVSFLFIILVSIFIVRKGSSVQIQGKLCSNSR